MANRGVFKFRHADSNPETDQARPKEEHRAERGEAFRPVRLLSGVESQHCRRRRRTVAPDGLSITYADISKAEQLLNYVPKTNFKQGITKFKNWLETQ